MLVKTNFLGSLFFFKKEANPQKVDFYRPFGIASFTNGTITFLLTLRICCFFWLNRLLRHRYDC